MPSRKIFNIGKDRLTTDSICLIAKNGRRLRLASVTRRMICRDFEALRAFASKHEVYGVTSSLGELLHEPVGESDIVPANVLRSHATGVGAGAPDAWVRATILVKAHQFSLGHSGVNPVVVDCLLKLLERRVVPFVPKYGSVGDGDVAPHAHIALILIGEGEASHNGRMLNGRGALQAARIHPFRLSNKEALSLISGTAYSTAIAALAIQDSYRILDAATVAASVGFEIIEGNRESYSLALTRLKDVNVRKIAKRLRKLMRGTSYQRRRLQDPLSFRCVPQVHGTVLEILKWADKLVEVEANSVADNPVIVGNEVYHGGNFYNSNVAVGADAVAQGLTYLAGMSERRTQILLKKKYTNLPEYLSPGEGDVGMMIAQYSAAANTARLRTLATPCGVHSIPTSGLQEDFVPMTTNACLRLHECVEVCREVIAIELCVAAAGLRLKRNYGSIAAKKIASLTLSDEISKRFIQMQRLIINGRISKIA